jgi:hypothetical protein
MTWKEFQVKKERYKVSWEKMKASYAGDIRRFLESSSLVVSAGREFDIDADIDAAREACPAFFLASDLEDSSRVQITSQWCVEIKFPYVDIDIIQELKSSMFCDKQRTVIKPSLTRVFVIPDR